MAWLAADAGACTTSLVKPFDSFLCKAKLRRCISSCVNGLQVDEHVDLAKPAHVRLNELLTMKLSEVAELSLSANQLQSDVKRLKWKAGDSMSGNSTHLPAHFGRHPPLMWNAHTCSVDALQTVLNPMEIKTFRLKLA